MDRFGGGPASDLLVDVLEASGQFAWISDEQGEVLDAAGATEEVLGRPVGDLIGKSIFELVHESDLPRARRRFDLLIEQDAPVRDFEVAVRHKDGSKVVLRIGGMAMRVSADGPRYIAVASDITRQREAEAALRRERARFTRIFEDAPGGIVLVHVDPIKGGRICRANRVACEIAGRSEDELIGMWLTDPDFMESTPESLRESLAQTQEVFDGQRPSFMIERVMKRPDGVRRHIRGRIASLDEDEIESEEGAANTIVHIEDITEQRQAELELRHMAQHDPLTDLLNRRSFTETLSKAIASVDGSDRPAGALLMLDLDSFKTVNDTYGHHAGDHVLRTVAEILREHIRETDPVGRLGGDEFSILLPTAELPAARRVAQGLIETMAATSIAIPDTDHARFTPFASIGIVMLDDPEVSPEDVLRRGDRVMYEAKKRGGSSYAE